MPSVATQRRFIDATEAARILELPDRRAVHRLVRKGLLGTRDVPCRERFDRSEVARLAAAVLRPALVAAG